MGQYSPFEPPGGFPFFKQARAVLPNELGQWSVLSLLLRFVCARGPDAEQNRMVRGDDLLGSGARITHGGVLRASCFRRRLFAWLTINDEWTQEQIQLVDREQIKGEKLKRASYHQGL